jgi:hypothetical protein
MHLNDYGSLHICGYNDLIKYSFCVSPLVTQNSICSGTSATLIVNSASPVNWYSTYTSSSSIASGSTLITASLTPGFYIFYAEASTCVNSFSRSPVSVSVSACTGTKEELIGFLTPQLFPNPTNSFFTISNYQGPVNIYNEFGKCVSKIHIRENERIVDLENFPKGLYLVQLTSSNEIYKLILR